MKRIAIILTVILSAAACGPRDSAEPEAPGDFQPPSSITTGSQEPSPSTDSSPTTVAPSEASGTESATSADDTQEALAEANETLALLDDLLAAMNAEIDGLGSDLAADATATTSADDS